MDGLGNCIVCEDDFDTPDGEMAFFYDPALTRREFVWTDKEGNKHKLSAIDDYYLNNIINFLKRKGIDIFEDTIRFLEKELKRRDKERPDAKVIC